MAREALLVAQPGKFPDKVCGQYVPPVGNGGPIIVAKISADLGKRCTPRAAVGGSVVKPCDKV